jgi:hypothetical protein
MKDYEKVNWEDSPSVATPLNAENLNHMDDGIEAATEAVTAVENDLKDNFYNAEEAEDYFLSQNDAKDTYVTKTELANKPDKATTLLGYGITDTYTKNQTDELLGKKANTQDVNKSLNAKQDALTFDSTPTIGSNNPVTSHGVAAALSYKADSKSVASKADKATTLAGYGITDAYTKDEIEDNYLTIIAGQNINQNIIALQSNVIDLKNDKSDKATTYTKDETDNLINEIIECGTSKLTCTQGSNYIDVYATRCYYQKVGTMVDLSLQITFNVDILPPNEESVKLNGLPYKRDTQTEYDTPVYFVKDYSGNGYILSIGEAGIQIKVKDINTEGVYRANRIIACHVFYMTS